MKRIEPQCNPPFLQFCQFILDKFTLNVQMMMFLFHQQVKYVHLYTYIYIYSTFTFRTIPHWGCMNILGLFSHLFPFSLKYLSRGRSHFFYLLSIWEKCKPARDKLVFMLLLPAYHSSSSAEPKTKDLCTPTGAIVSFWWLTVHGPRNWNFVFSVALLPVFFYTQQVLFY